MSREEVQAKLSDVEEKLQLLFNMGGNNEQLVDEKRKYQAMLRDMDIADQIRDNENDLRLLKSSYKIVNEMLSNLFGTSNLYRISEKVHRIKRDVISIQVNAGSMTPEMLKQSCTSILNNFNNEKRTDPEMGQLSLAFDLQ